MPNNNPGLLILYQVLFINIVPSFNFADHLMHVRQLHRSACLPLSVALIRPRMLAVHQLEARTAGHCSFMRYMLCCKMYSVHTVYSVVQSYTSIQSNRKKSRAGFLEPARYDLCSVALPHSTLSRQKSKCEM